MKQVAPYAYLYFALFILLVASVQATGHEGDVSCWVRWASHIQEHGLQQTYLNSNDDYNPFYQYVLWGYAQLCGSLEKIARYRAQLKIATLVFDFAGAILVAGLVRGVDANRRFLLSLIVLLNVSYLYNTLIWIQVDAILTFFVVAAVALALRRQVALSVVCYLLAYNTKVQAIVFFPIMGLLWLPTWLSSLRQLGLSLLAGTAAQLLLLLPFLLGGTFSRIVDINFHVTSYYQVASVSAYNFWILILERTDVSDWLTFGPFTYRQWGLVLFATFSGLAMLPVLAQTVRDVLRRRAFTAVSPDELSLILLAVGLIPLFFVFFNTQMHERYWHPALLPIAGYSIQQRRYGLLGVLSFAYLFQLDAVLSYFPTVHHTLVYMPWFLASLFGVCWVWGVIEVYRLGGRLRLLTQLRQAWQERGRQPAAGAELAGAGS